MKHNAMKLNIQPTSLDENEKTFIAIVSTGASYLRKSEKEPYYEQLVISEKSVNMTRLIGASFLNNHLARDLNDILGVVLDAWIADNVLYVKIKFSTRPELESIWNDIKAGIIRSISFAYFIDKYEIVKNKNQRFRTMLITELTPYEVSAVPIQVDPNAGIRSINPEEKENQNMALFGKIKKAKSENAHTTTETNETTTTENAKEPQAPAQASRGFQSHYDSNIPMDSAYFGQIAVLCQKRGLSPEQTENVFKNNKGIDSAKGLIAQFALENFEADNKVSRNAAAKGTEHNEITHAKRGIEAAFSHRLGGKLEEIGQNYRNISLLDAAKVLSRETEFDKHLIAERAIKSDVFGDVVYNAVHKKIEWEYGQLTKNYLPLITEVPMADFKTLEFTDTTTFTDLEKIGEGDPAPEAKLDLKNKKNSIKLETFSRKFSITRETIYNDDIGFISQIPLAFSRAAHVTEEKAIWACLGKDEKWIDNKPVFDKSHGNVVLNAKGIDKFSLEQAELLLAAQLALDNKPLYLRGYYLLVPTTLKNAAIQAMATIHATKVEDTNPYAGRFQIIDDPALNTQPNACYLVAHKSQIDIIKTAHLSGHKGIQLRRKINFDTQALEIIGNLDFAARLSSYKGLVQINISESKKTE